MEKLKRELNITSEADIETRGQFIPALGDFPLSGYHKDTDIQEADMDDDMKELHEVMDDALEMKSDHDEITDDFIQELNFNEPALVKKTFDEVVELPPEIEEDEDFFPPGLTDEMKEMLKRA